MCIDHCSSYVIPGENVTVSRNARDESLQADRSTARASTRLAVSWVHSYVEPVT